MKQAQSKLIKWTMDTSLKHIKANYEQSTEMPRIPVQRHGRNSLVALAVYLALTTLPLMACHNLHMFCEGDTQMRLSNRPLHTLLGDANVETVKRTSGLFSAQPVSSTTGVEHVTAGW